MINPRQVYLLYTWRGFFVRPLWCRKPVHHSMFPRRMDTKKRLPIRQSLSKKNLRGGERGIRTPGTVIPYDSLANCWFKPLTHLSVLDLKSMAKISSFCVSANLLAKNISPCPIFFSHLPALFCTIIAQYRSILRGWRAGFALISDKKPIFFGFIFQYQKKVLPLFR